MSLSIVSIFLKDQLHIVFIFSNFLCAQKKFIFSLQLCLTLCDPMDCSLPGSSVHGILRQESWSGLPFPSPGDLPDPRITPASLTSPALTGRFFTTRTTCSLYLISFCSDLYDYFLSTNSGLCSLFSRFLFSFNIKLFIWDFSSFLRDNIVLNV